MKRILSLVLSAFLVLSPIAEELSVALATLPGAHNEAVKMSIERALLQRWTDENIRIAQTPPEIRLLDLNNTNCLLLSNGNYLVRNNIAGRGKELFKAITAADIGFILKASVQDLLQLKEAVEALVVGFKSYDERAFIESFAGLLSIYFLVKYDFVKADDLSGEDRKKYEIANTLIDSGGIALDSLRLSSIGSRVSDVKKQTEQSKLAVYDLIRLNRLAPLSQSINIHKRKILLVASDVRDKEHLEADKKAGVFVAPPYGLFRLKAYLESINKAEVDVFDPNLYEQGMEEAFIGLIRSGHYYIIGFSPTHLDIQNDIDLIWRAKELVSDMGSDTLIMAGGQEVTFNSEMWLESAPIDLIALGYGEKVLETMIDRMNSSGRIDRDFLKKTKGVSFLDGNRCVKNPAVTMSSEEYNRINSISDVYENIPYEEYWDLNVRYYSEANLRARKATLRTVRMYTSTHCKNRCGFCSSCRFLDSAVGGNMPILASLPDRVISQLLNLCRKHDPEAVFFNDDDFIIDRGSGRERAIKICKDIIEAKSSGKLSKKIVFYAQMKARNLVTYDKEKKEYVPDLELIFSLKEAGFKLCVLGVETFSDKLAYSGSIDKKTSAAQSKAAIRGLLYAGVTPLINFILFPPETDKDDIVETIDNCFEFIKMGAQASLGTLIEIYPGAAVEGMDFPRSQQMITIPQSGKEMPIDMYVLPVDLEIRAIAGQIDEDANGVIAEFKDDPLYLFEYPPQILTVLAYFIATYRAMGLDDKAQQIKEFAEDVVIREEYYTIHKKPTDELVSIIRDAPLSMPAEVIKGYAYEKNQFDIPVLIKCYPDLAVPDHSGEPEDKRLVKFAIMRKIERILAMTQEAGPDGMDDIVRRELVMFSRVLINDDNVDLKERERFLAFLNYRTGISTRVDNGEYVIDENLRVKLHPEEKVFVDIDEIRGLFRGKKVTVFEAHNDDAVVYLGNLLLNIRDVASNTTVVTVFSDPGGVTDTYAHKYASQEGLPAAYYKSETGSKALKKSIRKKEGVRVFTGVDNLEYKCLGVEPEIEEGVYNATGRMFSYVTKYSGIGNRDEARLNNIITETDSDVIIMGYPGIAYQQNHRDLSRVLMKIIYQINTQRKVDGKPEVAVLLYDESIDRYLFASYGIKANLYNFFGPDGKDVKEEWMETYLSQTSRFPLYTYLMGLRDRERAREFSVSDNSTKEFAETLILLKGLEFTDDKMIEERRIFEGRVEEGIKTVAGKDVAKTRLRVLDNNVFFESGGVLVPGPIVVGRRIKSFLEGEKIISIMLDASEGMSENRIHDVISALDKDDLETLLDFALGQESCISFEVVGERPNASYRYKDWMASVRERMKKRDRINISGHQPGYHRYPGFFSKLAESDIFLFADDMKYTRDAWQSRQKVGGASGPKWMTVPLVKMADETLAEKRIVNNPSDDWREKHLKMIRLAYEEYPFFHLYEKDIERLYSMRWESLNALNEAVTRMLAGMLGIKDKIMLNSSYLDNDPSERKGERISSEIIKVLGDIINIGKTKVTYISGRDVEYMDEVLYSGRTNRDVIESKGIEVREQSFELDVLKKTWEDVDPTITTLDFLSRYGPLTGKILSRKQERIDKPHAPKILLVNSWGTGRDEGLSSAPPIGLYRMKKYVESNSDAAVDIFDPGIYEYPKDEIYRLLAGTDYDLIGFHPTYVNLETDLNVMWEIKHLTSKLGLSPVLISGGQTATMSSDLLREFSPTDAIVTGFGERALLEIVRRRASQFAEEDEANLLKGVDGTMLRRDIGGWEITPSTHLSQRDFEELTYEYDPVDVIPYENYWTEMKEMQEAKDMEPKMMARAFTSSHCPAGCGFCSSQSFLPISSAKKGVPVLAISAEKMYKMLKKAIETQGAGGLFFNDDNLLLGSAAGRERMIKFCRMVIDGKESGALPPDLIFMGQTRAKDITVQYEEGQVARSMGQGAERSDPDDDKHMEEILGLAEELLEKGGFPVAAKIVNNSTGESMSGVSKYFKETKLWDHSETRTVQAAVQAGWDLSQCTLYVTLENCYYCAKAVSTSLRVGRIVVGCDDPNIAQIGKTIVGSLGKVSESISNPDLAKRAREMLRQYKRRNPNDGVVIQDAGEYKKYEEAARYPRRVLSRLLKTDIDTFEHGDVELFDWAGYCYLNGPDLTNPQTNEQLTVINANSSEWEEGEEGDKNAFKHFWRDMYRINPKNGNMKVVIMGCRERCEELQSTINNYVDSDPVEIKELRSRLHEGVKLDFKVEIMTEDMIGLDGEGMHDEKSGYVPDKELLGLMKEAGFILLGIGIESFSDDLLKAPSINKKSSSAINIAAIDAVRTHGIKPVINIILVPPEATEENILQNIEYAVRYMRNGFEVNVEPFISYYPGAPVTQMSGYRHANRKGDVNGIEISLPDYFLPQDEVLAEKLGGLRSDIRKVIQEFRGDPYWIFKYAPKVVVSNAVMIAVLRDLGRYKEAYDLTRQTWDILIRDNREKYSKIRDLDRIEHAHNMFSRNLSGNKPLEFITDAEGFNVSCNDIPGRCSLSEKIYHGGVTDKAVGVKITVPAAYSGTCPHQFR
jgi:radical SAM superfamily enzyme YgiQ (UPF0313 family)/tRNA(Arg) A34 adenosine deaminase TadA